MSVDRAVILLPREGPGPAGPMGPASGKVLGLTLLERVVLTSAQAGVNDFLFVGAAGKNWEGLIAGLKRDRRIMTRALRLEFMPVSEIGESSREAKQSGPFWLIPGDLVFDPRVLEHAADGDSHVGGLLHLVDRRSRAGPERAASIGLKIDEQNGRATAFVEGLEQGSAAYAGISLCPPGFFSRLAALCEDGDGPRLDAETLNTIALPEGTRVVDVGGTFCRRVTTKAALKEARGYLLGTARKATDSFFTRHFNRHISLFLTRLLLPTGIPPNALSIVCLAIGLASCWFIARGGYLLSLLGAFLFEFASIFDGCDGEVARLTFRTSKLGGFLDMIGDIFIFVLFFLCLPVGLYRSSHRPVWIVLGVIALLSMGTFYLQLAAFMKKARLGNLVVGVVKDIEASAGRPGFSGRLDAIAAKIAFIYRRDFFSTVAFVVIGLGGSAVLMGLLGVFMPLEPVYMYFYSRRRFRAIAQPD
jgi:phosphatidylglycerophosphate synthase/choline kinase